MKRLLSLLVTIVFVCFVLPLHAQGNEIVQETLKARSASGTVYYGFDRSVLKDVSVQQCDAKFLSCIEVAKTDANGRYVLARGAVRAKIVYLKFVSLGFDVLELTVKRSPWARRLQVRLIIGT